MADLQVGGQAGRFGLIPPRLDYTRDWGKIKIQSLP